MKSLNLKIDSKDNLPVIAKALSSPVHLSIIELLNENSYNVNEISEKLSLPLSTTAVSIKMLEEAGLILAETQPGTRGAMEWSRRIYLAGSKCALVLWDDVIDLFRQWNTQLYEWQFGI